MGTTRSCSAAGRASTACPASRTLEVILLAQIEHHGTEVFYNLDPVRYPSAFVRQLPGCVKRSIAWRAAPSPGADFAAYDRVVCNFPSILKSYTERGWSAAFFFPAHDPVLDEYAANEHRPVDVLFVGAYSRHHTRRAVLLEQIASLSGRHSVVMHLDQSRLVRLAESPLGRLLPLGRHRRPRPVRSVSKPALFGRDMYAALSRAKVVLNGAVDMAGTDRGNMRCFEAFGAACALLTDAGSYPQGMTSGETMLAYADGADAVRQLSTLLADEAFRVRVAQSGSRMIRQRYSKRAQFERFRQLLD